MLAGEYGQWVNGEKSSYSVSRNEIYARPLHASLTRYGIKVSESSRLTAAGWSATGGMVARAARPGGDVELFGKEVARVHGTKGLVTEDDYSYEFFLVVRSPSTGQGRLVKQWRFPREELRLVTYPSGVGGFEIEGSISFDELTKTATVQIAGLLWPFEERVDLTHELP